jgi:beta-galactosidase/beta-glucuronidase
MLRRSLLLLIAAAAAVAQSIPRPEYPQPQFQRETWMSLNGQWEFEFDDANAGVKDNWQTSTKPFSRKILVPFCPESPESGIGDTAFHPWVWYRRSLTVPPSFQNKRTLLHFGAVDYRAWVWINGQFAGHHEGGSTPFRFDITRLLRPGANVVTLRAEDPPTDRTVPRGKQYWEPKSRGIFYTRTTGIWQPVWIEAAGDTYLDRVRITPRNDGSVRFEARIAHPAPDTDLVVAITRNNQTAASGSVKASGNTAHLELRVATPALWSPGSPNLYQVSFELRRGGTAADRVQSYFGFREVSLHSGKFYLNDRPTYLKMVLDQGYWPQSLLTPPTDEAIQFDIKASKELGFNGARKHQKVEDPRYLYWADRLGFLVSGEMANAYEFDPDYAARFTREWLEAVERDYNHPSVVMWVPINESWGTPNLHTDVQQQNHLKSNYWLTKSLDPTRPVIENDGWEHVDTTDLFSIHDYARDGERFYAKYKGLGDAKARIPDNGRAILVKGYQYNGTPFFLSEYGGIAYVHPGSNVPPDAWGYSGVEKTPDAALARLQSLHEAVAKIPSIMGVCYTQLTDIEQEINGLLTYDRKMKFDPAKIKSIFAILQ